MSETTVAVLTGGAEGIGAAFCKVLLENNYKVCVSDIQEEKGNQFAKELQEKYGTEKVKFIVCDVSNEDDYKRLFDFAVKEFKKINLVINNAGIVLEQNPRKTIEVNLIGPLIGCQLALKYMGKSNGGRGGMVINTASVAGFLPGHATPAYNASKHGVIGLTRCYGTPYHLQRDGVLFAAICPFGTKTELMQMMLKNTLDPEYDPYKKFPDKFMSPEYVAQSIFKLLEDRINGATLLVTKKGFAYVDCEDLKKYIDGFL